MCGGTTTLVAFLLAVVCNFDKKKLINCLYLCIYHSEGVNLRKNHKEGVPS